MKLENRMKQENITRKDIRKCLGVSEKTIRNKLAGKTDFTWSEVKLIRSRFFPKDSFEELFE